MLYKWNPGSSNLFDNYSNQNLFSFPLSHCIFFYLGLSWPENDKKDQSPKQSLTSLNFSNS